MRSTEWDYPMGCKCAKKEFFIIPIKIKGKK
jgi:hypothetical protein